MTIVKVKNEGSIRCITFDRPGKINALRDEDLLAVIEALETRPEGTEVVIFQGANGNFSAGMYVEEFSGFDLNSSMAHIRIGAKFLDTIRSLEIPTIAAIEGYCVGLAFDVSLVCDFRIATDKSSFSMPEINVGMPCVMDISLLQQHIGMTRAKEMLLTGGFYPARQMEEWGFLNRVVPAGTARDAAAEFAEKHLLGRSPAAVASQKRLFEVWLQHPHKEGVQISLMEYGMNFANPDTQSWITKYRAEMAAKKQK
ncbi:enoyl-CoA hydratase/isomerase family protein [Acrocarpospora pleiomorpha]|nr:enoyl-CoA hydratase/isomerase family protein [Acrocarpospora pleiomorpha]